MSLPFVFLKMLPDFWQPFVQYAQADQGHCSTFFLVPFKGRPGRPLNGSVDRQRAVPYAVGEIREEAEAARAGGNEIAVHGIDAWCDARAGQAELGEVASIGGAATAGVRMHWLYFGEESPRQLESAGFAYDSTWGYNEAVGYRAGTSQVFRLPGSELMELPLVIMDSALFFRGRMGVSEGEALQHCREVVANHSRYGGTLVVNWHDRSLAPERLWGRTYRALLGDITQDASVWFATARDAVRWFKWRRAVTFTSRADGSLAIAAPKRDSALPAARIWVYDAAHRESPKELSFDGEQTLELAL